MHELRTPDFPGSSARSSRVITDRISLRAAATGVAAALAVLPAAAQSPPLVVSTSADLSATAGHDAIDDAGLVRVEKGGVPSHYFSEGHWQGAAGRVPGDVDGIAVRPSFHPADHRALAFTMQSDEGGFEDGDVLTIAQGGGFEVVHAETDLAAALAFNGSGFDLDAIAYDDQGRLLFSLQANLAATVLGPIEDGDVLRLEADGTVSRVFFEADVQSAYSAATGLVSSVGDVLALEFQAGEVWVGIQSPSSADGGVLVLGAVPRIEYDEDDLGLDGAELDGLFVLNPLADVGRLHFSEHSSSPGSTVVAEFARGGANHPLLVFLAGNAGFVSTEAIATGFGGVFLDVNDPWLSMLPTQVIRLDANGFYTQILGLPVNNFGGVGFEGEPGWTFVTIDVWTLEVSAPYRIAL